MNLPIEPIDLAAIVYIRCEAHGAAAFQTGMATLQQTLKDDIWCAIFAPDQALVCSLDVPSLIIFDRLNVALEATSAWVEDLSSAYSSYRCIGAGGEGLLRTGCAFEPGVVGIAPFAARVRFAGIPCILQSSPRMGGHFLAIERPYHAYFDNWLERAWIQVGSVPTGAAL